jgi:hypothetical protein
MSRHEDSDASAHARIVAKRSDAGELRSMKITELKNYRCCMGPDEPSPQYCDIINFERSGNTQGCVMCGEVDNIIPIQNKSVCRACDGAFWFQKHMDIVVKFCKGRFITVIIQSL